MTEDQLQAKCFLWANQKLPKTRGLLWACPNGGKRDGREAVKLKSTGVVPGIADLHLDIPNAEYHGLKIEMKVPREKSTHKIKALDPAQKVYQEKVTQAGYLYVVCDDFEDFQSILIAYLKETTYI